MINRKNSKQSKEQVKHFRRYSMMPHSVPVCEAEKDARGPKEELIEQVLEKTKSELGRLSSYGLKLVQQVKELEDRNKLLNVELSSTQIDKDLLENALYEEKQAKLEMQLQLGECQGKLEKQTQAFSLLREDFQRVSKKNETLRKDLKSVNERMSNLTTVQGERRKSMPSPMKGMSEGMEAFQMYVGNLKRKNSEEPNKEIVNKEVERTKYRMERRLSRANNAYHTKLQKTEVDHLEAVKDLVTKKAELATLNEYMEKNGMALRWIEDNHVGLKKKTKELREEVKDTRAWSIKILNSMHEDFRKIIDVVDHQLLQALEKSIERKTSELYPSVQKKVISDLGIMEMYDKGILWPYKKGSAFTRMYSKGVRLETLKKKKQEQEEEQEERCLLVSMDINEVKLFRRNEEIEVVEKKWNMKFCRHFYSASRKSFFIEFSSGKKKKKNRIGRSSLNSQRKFKRRREKEDSEDENVEEEEEEEITSEVLGLRFDKVKEEQEWKSFMKFLLPTIVY